MTPEKAELIKSFLREYRFPLSLKLCGENVGDPTLVIYDQSNMSIGEFVGPIWGTDPFESKEVLEIIVELLNQSQAIHLEQAGVIGWEIYLDENDELPFMSGSGATKPLAFINAIQAVKMYASHLSGSDVLLSFYEKKLIEKNPFRIEI